MRSSVTSVQPSVADGLRYAPPVRRGHVMTRKGNMDTERSIEQIKENLIPILSNWDTCRVVRYEYDEDFESGHATLILTIRSVSEVARILFSHVHLNGDPITPLRDATGLYIIDTAFLGWDKGQKIEVGDWDEGPPIFWSEKVEKI